MKQRPSSQRSPRRYSDAERVIIECELEKCVHCGGELVASGTWHMRKHVQTLKGPVFVAGKSKQCGTADCAYQGHHYHASGVLRISLPQSTYGLDVMAQIGWQHEREHKQFVEIQEQLHQQGIEVSERHVGRLYRQFLALLGGMDGKIEERLEKTAAEHGGLIWGIDALQPEGHGTLLYVLYEVLSGTPVAGVQRDHPTADELVAWLAPYRALPYKVLATLSDGEDTIIATLERCWPGAPRQRCHIVPMSFREGHFLGNLAEGVLKVDHQLQAWMKNDLAGLPAVPAEHDSGSEEAASEANVPPFLPPDQGNGMQS